MLAWRFSGSTARLNAYVKHDQLLHAECALAMARVGRIPCAREESLIALQGASQGFSAMREAEAFVVN